MKKSKKIVAILVALAIVLSVVVIGVQTILSSPKKSEFSYAALDTMSEDYAEYVAKKHLSDATDEVVVSAENFVTGVTPEDSDTYGSLYQLSDGESAAFRFSVPKDGAYQLAVTFSDADDSSEKYHFSLRIDGKLPFESCEKLTLHAVWVDQGGVRTLTNGDQVSALQKHQSGFHTQTISDAEGITVKPYRFMLPKGEHTVTLTGKGRAFLLAELRFTAPEKLTKYQKTISAYDNAPKYEGKQISVQAEKPLYKTAYSLSAKSDQGSADLSPCDPVKAKINYIGGQSWTNCGEKVAWEMDVPEDGLYTLGISFKQNFVTNGEVYRWLRIDGKTPFSEASAIAFPYATKWQFMRFSDSDNNDYLFYLEKGKHELSLEVTLSDIAEVFKRLDSIVEPLGDLYLDMVMITGETPDANRDYELHKQIPGFEAVLTKQKQNIDGLVADMESDLKANGELSGALKNMSRILGEMSANLYEAHLQIPSYYSAQQTLSSWLYDIKNMSLSIDQIVLAAPEKRMDTPQADFLQKIKVGLMRYASSYTKNAVSVKSSEDDELPSIKIWVNWGRDQVKILNTLIQDSFTPEEKVNVLVEQVNATLVQGVISGNSPDLYLHMARTEPVNLAMRGVLYDLKKFPDYREVLKQNFKENAETPYLYRGGCYALPDTQQFFVMFYRKDILDKLGIEVPATWDDFLSATGILQRNKMNVYLPYTKLGAATTVNIGVGGLSIFPTMLLQNGGSMYNEAQNATALANKPSINAFKFWTEFYTRYSLDPDANFYQKFRVGTIPLGIANYTQYLQFSVAAPEIADKWAISEIPGNLDANGVLQNICSGSGTGCSIMNSCRDKDSAWKFIKWWISEETQYRYSTELEAILGYTGRVSSANAKAVSRLSWDEESLKVIMNQWDKVKEVAEVPGSYYVSRSIDQAFWSTKNGKKSAKESIMDWSVVSDKEIARKIKEYS